MSTHTTTRSPRTRGTAAIEVAGLRKSYGDHLVLDGIDFTVPTGSIFSMLGPNGAGKTTTVQILSTLIKPDAGVIRVAGHDLAAAAQSVRGAIGVTGQFSAVDNLLTGQENLRLMADLNHLTRAEGRRRSAELLERFELTDAAAKQPATYSGGMRRRLDLAMTLMGDPRLIFLDEPTTGLDPAGRRVMWRIIRDLVDEGVTIFLTTQYLEEADQLADQVAVLDKGTLVAQGTPAELKRLIPGGHITLRFNDVQDLDTAANTLTVSARDETALTLQTPSEGDMKSLRALLARLDAAEIEPADLSIHTPDLDDVFLALTGHDATTKDSSQ
ncbi:ATP-binding cassette domain-containing protein [Stackebrandtia nassauensis]|uniref:Daunorubicin resistance ABC transporter ATPase subunit n=1 Tax=Stackebrandtia nassauensis (strain DSM 44728 / CIP 108903 / NRRL B-16338 / NBRC 102104 / LLR-40K-21) TaxID=446470 RepID=D3PWZ5_STANL|nr:ATP-binding cassette domain-containing protein [Stackebrandtia nassauensis]ADD45219.1 daunorubicin resistance ABC transporter ATPase subunit [Stackebrandtia nassauensis DSM 44728]